MTTIIDSIQALNNTLQKYRLDDKTIALVPTMGNLHHGHISLVEQAQQSADIVVVSIFVNPTQFGEGEDFDSYPRTLTSDVEKLATVNTDYVFAPSVHEMYPNFPTVPNTHIDMGSLTTLLCGQSRPTHFDGVGLVVSKLFNIVRPNIAVFGKKDYQQLALIRQLVSELNFPIQIVAGDIVRAEDGLALSSRNQYLTEQERKAAPRLNQIITNLGQRLSNNEQLHGSFATLIAQAKKEIVDATYTIDYLEILTQKLTTPNSDDKHLVILVAACLGKARLLDNLEVTLEGK